MGTPDFAVPALRAVSGVCDVVQVVTPPDRARGRGMSAAPCAVASAAETLGLPVLKTDAMRSEPVREALAALQADLFAVVAFGSILTPAVLATPRLGCINLHGSLLPHYRGASPVQRALWDGCAGSGVTTLWMDEGVDTGDLILQRWAPVDAIDTAGTLATRLAELGGPLLAESLLLAHAGRAPRAPQARSAGSYAKKLTKADGVIDWSRDAIAVWNQVRAVTPWPGATALHRGKRLIVTRALPHHVLPHAAAAGQVLGVTAEGVAVACAPGVLLLSRVKAEGRAEMPAVEWARGSRVAPGDELTMIEEAHA